MNVSLRMTDGLKSGWVIVAQQIPISPDFMIFAWIAVLFFGRKVQGRAMMMRAFQG
ncbi:MAG: hypothetical protein ACYCY3_11090 [Halothiobacillus sp.]